MLLVLAVLHSVTQLVIQLQSSVGSHAVSWSSVGCSGKSDSALSVTAECCSVLHAEPVLVTVVLASTVAIVLFSDQGIYQ